MSRQFNLSSYGCIRFRSLPYARLVSQFARDGYTFDGHMKQSLATALTDIVLRPQLDGITATVPPANWPMFQANAMLSVQSAAIHASWVCYGRQIFEIAPNLVSAFRLTDVGHSSFEGLHLPYRAFFLHFGLQPDLILDDPGRLSPEFVDGAYIFQDGNNNITIELTLSRSDEPASNLPGLQITIEKKNTQLAANDAITKAIDEAIKKNQSAVPATGITHSLTDEVKTQSAEWLELCRDVLVETASLVSNALFYLSEPQDNITLTVEHGAPPNLVAKVIQGNPMQQQRATQSLTAEGFAVVRYCGSDFLHNFQSAPSFKDGFAKSHWRRGHWRNQRHGAALTEVKRIWIRPVLVKAEVGDPENGRIYLV